MDVYNASSQETERISTLYLLNGKERKDTPELGCGDMGAIIKLKHSHTNNTLCDSDHPIILDEIRFPKPEIRAALVTVKKGDEDRVGMGLASLHQEDPTFHYNFDGETRETIVSGQGEMQLDIVVNRLKHRFNVEVELESPKIPFRETIRKSVTIHKRYKKQTGGRGQFGDVHIEVKPLHRGGGFDFINNIVGGVIPTKFIPAVEKGVKAAMEEGHLVGANIVDLSVRLFDGSYHAVDSSDMAFQVAGSMALREAMDHAAPIILEPIYKLEIRVPESYMGSVMGDVSSRRGKVLGMEADGQIQVISAEVPLAELWKYSTQLRSMTQGRGMHSREFSHYDPVPREVQTKLVEAYQESREH
jgi:elongation factor G